MFVDMDEFWMWFAIAWFILWWIIIPIVTGSGDELDDPDPPPTKTPKIFPWIDMPGDGE